MSPKRAAFVRVARRVLLLFLLGLIYNNILQFRFDSQRYAGVLQRIAICYGIAAIIFLLTKVRTQVILFLAILIGYWAILMFVPSPESRAGDLTMETNLAGYLDRHFLPGKINPGYYGFGDNEGLLSTIPAVATALLGVLAGQWLASRAGALDQGRWLGTRLGSFASGWEFCGAVIFRSSRSSGPARMSWSQAAGACSCSRLFYTIIDVIGLRFWAYFFVVIGVNAITIYVASADHSLFRDVAVSSGRSCPALGLVRPGAAGDRNAGDRMAAAASSLPQPDFLAGLS